MLFWKRLCRPQGEPPATSTTTSSSSSSALAQRRGKLLAYFSIYYTQPRPFH